MSMSTITAPMSWEEGRTCRAGGALTMTSTQNTNDPHQTTSAPPAEPASEEAWAAEDFTTSAGLRALLDRLHAAGPDAWTGDPVAQDLMRYAADKYAALARKHHLDPWEAASAAFDVMRTPSARRAMDRSEERRVGKEGRGRGAGRGGRTKGERDESAEGRIGGDSGR